MQDLGKSDDMDGLKSYLEKNTASEIKPEDKSIYSYFSERERWVEKYIHPSGRTKDWSLDVDEIEDHQI